MLNPEERFNFWEEWYKAVHKMFVEAEDALDSQFAPYRFDDDGVLIPQDKDTPEARKRFNYVADLEAFLKRRLDSSSVEYSAWLDEQENVRKAFEAWSLGLCPSVMSSVRKHMDFYYDKWPEIAKLKQERGISREDTEQAVALWDARCNMKRAS